MLSARHIVSYLLETPRRYIVTKVQVAGKEKSQGQPQLPALNHDYYLPDY